MTFTSNEFLDDLKRLITIPANQSRFTDTDFLAFTFRKLQDTVVPVIDSLEQEFFVVRSTVPIVSGQTNYPIPTRALGRKLREVKIIGPSGGRSDFPKVAIEREQFYRASGTPFGWFFMGDHLEIVPVPTALGFSLQLWWFVPPGKPVLTTSAAQVQSVTYGPLTDDVTVTALPTNFVAGTVIDFIAGMSGNAYLGLDKTILADAPNTLTFTLGDVPTDLAPGDWISVSGTSPVLQIPDPAEPYLVTLTAMEILQAIGDFEGRDALKETREMQDKNLKLLLEPRVEGEATPIINDYGFIGGPRRGLWGLWQGSV